MNELEIYIIYGYVLPLLIMVVWTYWRIFRYLSGEHKKFALYRASRNWPLLIPGVALLGLCIVLLMAFEDLTRWIDKKIFQKMED